MTRKIQTSLFALALLASLRGFSQASDAPATSPVAATTKVGIIDFVAAVANTNEGVRELQSLAAKFEPKRVELANLGKEIEDLQKQLQAQDGKLNDEARASLVRNIEQKQKNYQRLGEDAQNDYQNQQKELFQRVGSKVYETLDRYAKEHAYTVILDVSDQQSPVRWASESTNITKAIVDAYNASSGVAAPPKPAAGTPSSRSAPGAASSPKPTVKTPTPR